MANSLDEFEYKGETLINAERAAEILQLSDYRIRELARKEELDAVKINNKWWFKKAAVIARTPEGQLEAASSKSNIKGL